MAAPDAPRNVHPDALLLRCARRAALDLAPRGPELGCGPAAGLLAARAERTLRPADATLLNRHLETCEHCRDLAQRLDAADRAYREASDAPLAPEQLAPMVAALAAAAPVRAVAPKAPALASVTEPPEPELAAAPEGEGAAEPEPGPEETPDSEARSEPAPEPGAAIEAEAEAALEPEPALEPVPEPALASDAPQEPEPAPQAAPATLPEPEAEAEAAETPEAHPEPEVDHDRERPTAPIRRSAYYQVPPAPAPQRRRKARQAARGALAAGGAAASLSKRAGNAARRRLERPAAEQSFPNVPDEPAVAPDTTTWQRLDPIEFPPRGRPASLEPAAESPAVPFEATPLPEPDQQESAARAAARHYRRLRHSQQRRPAPAPAADGSPPRLLRPARDRPHLPLGAHGPRDLALPAGLVVIAALVIMAVSGVFGGGSSTPSTGTLAHAVPVVAPVAESVTAMSTADAVRLTSAAGGPRHALMAADAEILAIGRGLAAALPTGLHPMKALDDRAMDLASQDADLRAALFRFVDVVPACRSLDDLAAHLSGFLDEVEDRPMPLDVAMRMGGSRPGRAALGRRGRRPASGTWPTGSSSARRRATPSASCARCGRRGSAPRSTCSARRR